MGSLSIIGKAPILNKLINHKRVKVFQILIGLVLSFSALTFGCKKAEMPSDNPENFVIDSIRVLSINNEPLYVNYNINNTRIDALVENDGISGKVFHLS